MRNPNSKQLLFRLLFILFLIASIFLTIDIAMNFYSRYTSRIMLEELKDQKPVPPEIVSDEVSSPTGNSDKDSNVKITNLAISEKPEMLKRLKEKNPDTIAWIEIPGTGIDHPVMQSSTNTYYLRKNFDHKYNITGSIFADYRNSPDFEDQNTVIYGHNMRDGSMFYDISLFMDENFYKEYDKIIITLDNKVLEYTIFSVYETQKDYDYRSPEFEKATFESKLSEFKNKSLIKSDALLNSKSKILTLSTCGYSFKDSRIALHGVLTSIVEF